MPEFQIISSLRDHLGQQSQWTVAAIVFIITISVLALKSWWDDRASRSITDEFTVGEITPDELQRYSGQVPFLPLLLAVRGVIYDVTKGKEFYGPGGGYAKFAGNEVARALAIMSLKEEDLTADLHDVTEKQLQTLADWEKKFKEKYPVVGRVCEPLKLTLTDLRKYDGSDLSKPILLAIKGTIFDVTKGKQFYGPDGVYPFAGRECARALALLSTNTSDCSDDLDGLEEMELDNLRNWQGQFYSKYKLVGDVVRPAAA